LATRVMEPWMSPPWTWTDYSPDSLIHEPDFLKKGFFVPQCSDTDHPFRSVDWILSLTFIRREAIARRETFTPFKDLMSRHRCCEQTTNLVNRRFWANAPSISHNVDEAVWLSFHVIQIDC
jgi:hypothetical protein